MKNRIQDIKISGIRSFTAIATQIEDMRYLTIGEPDFDTPEIIKEAAKEALDQNLTHYPPALGIDALREKIAAYENTLFGESLKKDNIIITNGATEGLVLAMWTLLSEGQSIVQPTPGYTLYQSQVHLANGQVKALDISKNNFQIDEASLRALVDEKTTAILLTSPNNPTGQVLTKESLDAVASIMEDFPKLHAILDDVYNVFVYDTELHSLREHAALRDRLIVVQAFSKSHAMTGWRLGYIVAPTPLIDEMHKLHQNLMAGVNSIAQYAALKAFDVDNSYMREEYIQRRDYVYNRLVDMGMDVLKPEGAFYIFPNIEKYGMSSYDFCLKCAQDAKVALIPGVYFGSDAYVRLSYCYSMDVLKESLDRLEMFVESLDKA